MNTVGGASFPRRRRDSWRPVGLALVYGRSTMSNNSTGAPAGRVYQQGAKFANGEFIQFHPTGIPGHDKNRLMSEACRGEGGRVWVPQARSRRQAPARAIFRRTSASTSSKSGIRRMAIRCRATSARGQSSRSYTTWAWALTATTMVYLDLTHKPREFLEARLGGILEMYRDVHRRGSVHAAAEDFPRGALFDGRYCGSVMKRGAKARMA